MCNNQILGNTFFQGENYQFKSMMFLQDTTSENESEFQLESFKDKGSFKSPGKALLYSGVLPGMGQAYMGNWLRGLLFVGLDAAAIGIWYNNNDLADEKKKEYSYYANEHWDFGTWINNYYNWYPEAAPEDFSGNQELWDSIREAFINKTDSTAGCHVAPYCYKDIWDSAHEVEFTYNDSKMSSSSEEFKDIFNDLCGNNTNNWDKKCSNDVINLYDSYGDTIIVTTNHHFYEGIQKYNMYFAGWDDGVDSIEVVELDNNTKNANSPHKKEFQSLWLEAGNLRALSANAGKFMLINRVVSMVDAILLAKKWNNNHAMKLSLNAYPDLRNKSGLGGVKLSLYWE